MPEAGQTASGFATAVSRGGRPFARTLTPAFGALPIAFVPALSDSFSTLDLRSLLRYSNAVALVERKFEFYESALPPRVGMCHRHRVG